ncbi:DUF7547 family protein [Haloterrigena alkaliphila]|uniref:Uncharacterized protein n=1 Tax=Haloterrigena alkaliphila TaxID=2816475 RepID=A0A8A2VEB6_9EURY|nr:hypothetical protein [Haloterrigena alkaliphila]QSW98754.1 hypothetical protein J0X25_15350 [Haloterrigena alkaliphila]
MADHDDELADAVRELTRTIDDLRTELESTRPRSRRRPPFPRPPTPRELLRVTDEVAIPAAIAVLETSVRALKGFQRALELARTEREVRDRTTDATAATSERARDLRQSTLDRLDTVLSELQRAASDGTLPADESARELLSEARALREDVDRRLRGAGDDLERRERESSAAADAIRIDIEDGDVRDETADDDPDPGVDVDAELETLKDQFGADDDGDGTSDGGDPSSSSADDDGNESGENGAPQNSGSRDDSDDDRPDGAGGENGL